MYTVNGPKILHYNISDTSISFNTIQTCTKLSFQISVVCYMGLQRIETDEESKLTFIDEDVHYIPLNFDITKVLNRIYLAKNELYTELNDTNQLIYHKITDKNVMALIINPYNDEYYLKNVIEFNNKTNNFPYKIGSIHLPQPSTYRIKITITKCNEIIYDGDIVSDLASYNEIPINLALSKKNETIHIRIINLSNMLNLQLANVQVA